MHRTLLARAAPEQLRQDWIVVVGHERRPARVSGNGGGIVIEFEGRKVHLEGVRWRPGQASFRASLDGKPFTATVRPAAEGFVIRHRAARLQVLVLTPRSAELHEKLPPKRAADTSKMVVSPMPGLVVTLDVTVGQQVRAGEAVAVIEAMKMQNIIRAERDGTVKAVNAQSGDSVAADEVLVEFA
jgi:propionyl-CoA carboxylase alpha chain